MIEVSKENVYYTLKPKSQEQKKKLSILSKLLKYSSNPESAQVYFYPIVS